MKPELLSAKVVLKIAKEAVEKVSIADEGAHELARSAAALAILSALEELKVERVIERPALSNDRCEAHECPLFNASCGFFCPDQGAVLVRVEK